MKYLAYEGKGMPELKEKIPFSRKVVLLCR